MLEHLLALATEGGQIAMRYYCKLESIEKKSDESPLTAADLAVDAHLFDNLTTAFPGIPVVTEERSASQIDAAGAQSFFLVDPIDGTKEFVAERGEFTINIALIDNGAPVAGVVCAPAIGRSFAGIVGEQALQCDAHGGNREKLCVATPDNDALVAMASRSHLTRQTSEFLAANRIARTTNAGSSLKFCLLAAGEADIYPRFGPTMEWDTAAGHAVLASAGGCVDGIDGYAMRYGKPGFRNHDFIAYAQGVEFTLPGGQSA